jgi:hypothetical protein
MAVSGAQELVNNVKCDVSLYLHIQAILLFTDANLIINVIYIYRLLLHQPTLTRKDEEVLCTTIRTQPSERQRSEKQQLFAHSKLF